jgi:hypothetical protein
VDVRTAESFDQLLSVSPDESQDILDQIEAAEVVTNEYREALQGVSVRLQPRRIHG